jgi:hypothetical protein
VLLAPGQDWARRLAQFARLEIMQRSTWIVRRVPRVNTQIQRGLQFALLVLLATALQPVEQNVLLVQPAATLLVLVLAVRPVEQAAILQLLPPQFAQLV